MTATTFTATTADGSTVVRTSSSREYTFVLLGTRGDQAEGALSWHGDKANADKAAQTWSSRGMITRVVPVEQALTGKAARLAVEAAKGVVTIVTTAPEAAPSVPVEPAKAKAGATTRRTRTKAATASTAPTGADLVTLADEIKRAEEALAELTTRRNSMIAELIASKTMSGPAVAKQLGMTPMGVYNAAKRAAK